MLQEGPGPFCVCGLEHFKGSGRSRGMKAASPARGNPNYRENCWPYLWFYDPHRMTSAPMFLKENSDDSYEDSLVSPGNPQI